MLKYFMGDLSFFGKVSLDFCPKGGTFSQGVFSEFLSILFSFPTRALFPQTMAAKAGPA